MRSCSLQWRALRKGLGIKKLAIAPCKLPNRGWSMSRGSLTRDYFSWEGMLTVGSDILVKISTQNLYLKTFLTKKHKDVLINY